MQQKVSVLSAGMLELSDITVLRPVLPARENKTSLQQRVMEICHCLLANEVCSLMVKIIIFFLSLIMF